MSTMPEEQRPKRWVMQAAVRALNDVRTWARAGYPNEVCGLLIGSRAISSVEVVHAVQARNRAAERPHERFELDPLDHLTAERTAEEQGLEVVGIWHSHPDHPARPSERDRDAAWAGWSYVVVAVDARGRTEVRSWRLNEAREFVEEQLELA